MPTGAEVLRDGTIGGEETLGLTRGFEPLHPSLSLAGRLVRVLCPVVEIAMLAMFHAWEQVALGGPIALEFVGDDDTRDVGQAFKEFAEELLRGRLITAALDQDIQYVPVLIRRPPEIMTLALDGQKHLVHVPLIAWARAAATQLVGIVLAKLAAPFANRLVGHDYATFQQYLLHIPEAQAEAKVQSYCVTNDLHRKAVVLVLLRGWRCIHATTLPYSVGTQQVDNASTGI